MSDTVKLKVESTENDKGFRVTNQSDKPLECDFVNEPGPPIMVPPGCIMEMKIRWRTGELPTIEQIKDARPDIAEEIKRISQSGETVEVLMTSWRAKDGGLMVYNHSLDGLVIGCTGLPPIGVAPGAVAKFGGPPSKGA